MNDRNCAGRPAKRTLVGDCSPTIEVGPRPTLASMVRAYVARHRDDSREELRSFKNEPTLSSAIERAGMAKRADGKRYNHQRRLQDSVLHGATVELRRANLAAAEDFDDLYNRVERAIGSLTGIGELMVYDTSLRLGAHLRLLPGRVYLHRGTRVGARALGLDWKAKSLAVGDCPREFSVLKAYEIEDCLCLFHDKFTASV